MKEWVFLPLQKYKELVDCTKRTNDIITGFVKSKNHVDTHSTERKAGENKKRVKIAPKSSKPKKIKRSEPEEHPSTPEQPPTPDQSSASDSDESTAF